MQRLGEEAGLDVPEKQWRLGEGQGLKDLTDARASVGELQLRT